MEFSERLDAFGEEIFASLNEKRLALEAEGRTIYNLSVGTPDFPPARHIVDALVDAAREHSMWKYSLRDLPELKQAVCDYYERRFGVAGITPDMVTSVNGTQEGVGHFAGIDLDAGPRERLALENLSELDPKIAGVGKDGVPHGEHSFRSQ